jgi:hypothetical protein
MEVRKIDLGKGNQLEITMSEAFVSRVREHFDLGPYDEITDRHLRKYVHGAMMCALDRACMEACDG